MSVTCCDSVVPCFTVLIVTNLLYIWKTFHYIVEFFTGFIIIFIGLLYA